MRCEAIHISLRFDLELSCTQIPITIHPYNANRLYISVSYDRFSLSELVLSSISLSELNNPNNTQGLSK